MQAILTCWIILLKVEISNGSVEERMNKRIRKGYREDPKKEEMKVEKINYGIKIKRRGKDIEKKGET